MLEILKEALGRIDRGETLAWVTVVQTKGSTPREIGAKMLVNKNGLIAGTIGGGITEARVIEEAKQALKEGKGKLLDYHLTKEQAALDEEAICGGEMKVFIDVLQPKEEVLIVNHQDEFIGIGTAKMPGSLMLQMNSGVAVDTRKGIGEKK